MPNVTLASIENEIPNKDKRHINAKGEIILHRLDEGYEAWLGDEHFIIEAEMNDWVIIGWAVTCLERTGGRGNMGHFDRLKDVRAFLQPSIYTRA
jgi:hypothetical protein